MSSGRRERLFALDVLRGLAVILVLLRHARPKPGSGEPVLDAFHQLGWTGVDLFFVLSGFLISRLLFDEIARTGGLAPGRFWLRRGLKIWPAYYLVYGSLAAATMIDAALHDKPTYVERLWPNLFFVQNYFEPRVRWPHSWSIAIEEHFYLVLPIVLLGLIRLGGARRLRWLPWLCVAGCVAILAARLHAGAPGSRWLDFYYPTHYRADSLLFGVLLGYGFHAHRPAMRWLARAWPVWLAGAVGVAGLAAAVTLEKSSMQYTLGFTLLYLGYGGAVLTAAAYPQAGVRNPLARVVAWMGVYSYTIYLAHSVVLKYPGASRILDGLHHVFGDSPWVDRCAFWALSIGVGYAVARLIEQPVLHLRDRMLPARA